MKSPSPAFSFYPKDILSDEDASSMTLEERGAYVTLLCHAWLEGSIPKDPIKLARLLKVRPSKLAKLWPSIAPCWGADPSKEERLIQARLEKERGLQRGRSLKQSERGRKGGRPLKSTKEESRGFIPDKPRVSRTKPEKSLPSPSPFPSPFPEQIELTEHTPAQVAPDSIGAQAVAYWESHGGVVRSPKVRNQHISRANARVKDGATLEDLSACVDYAATDEFYVSKRYLSDPSVFWRNAERVEKLSSSIRAKTAPAQFVPSTRPLALVRDDRPATAEEIRLACEREAK